MKINTRRPGQRHQALVLAAPSAAFAALPQALRQHAEERLRVDAQVLIPSLSLLDQAWVLVLRLPQGAVALRRRGGAVARALVAVGATRLVVAGLGLSDDDSDNFLLGMAQGAYAYTRYQQQKTPELQLSVAAPMPPARRKRLESVAIATAGCRDLINTPAMDCGPADVVAAARRWARGTGLKVTVWDAAKLQRAGCGCITAVGAAAGKGREARLLIVEWPGKTRDHIALCGKGVCFDSGGLQIKPGKSMELMRKDMGGAATVLAALRVHAQTGGRQGVRAYIPLVENAIAGNAFRPGDVLTAADGTTIEVGHTDAEGRLVLADALALARQHKARSLLTVATLTGAALVALGRIHVPLMASDDALAEDMLAAAATTGEKMWRLPLDEDHHAAVRSRLATLTNSAGPEAACITAGAFLAHFAGDLPFAHCDISPTSWRDSPHDLGPAGATGILVDTLARFLASAG